MAFTFKISELWILFHVLLNLCDKVCALYISTVKYVLLFSCYCIELQLEVSVVMVYVRGHCVNMSHSRVGGCDCDSSLDVLLDFENISVVSNVRWSCWLVYSANLACEDIIAAKCATITFYICNAASMYFVLKQLHIDLLLLHLTYVGLLVPSRIIFWHKL